MTRSSAATGLATSSPLAFVINLVAATIACVTPNPDRIEADDSAASTTPSGAGETDSGEGNASGMGGAEDGTPLELMDVLGDELCMAGDTELSPACSGCLEQLCCTELVACADDPDCVCVSACVFAGASDLECSLQCGLDGALELPTLARELDDCSDLSCADACGAQ